MLGSCFLKHMAAGNYQMYGFDKIDLDITNPVALREVFMRISPQIVLNCAGYTDVDGCEKNKDLAFKVNAEAVGEIAKNCAEKKSLLIHFSTDYVFNGEKSHGYKEDDQPNPINVYGSSKLKGEEFIKESGCNHYIVRTSWLFGDNGKNFVDTIIDAGKNNAEIDVVSDQTGCPTYTSDLCKTVLTRFIDVDKPLLFGIYHIVNSGNTTWFDFAKKIFELKKMTTKINPITSDKLIRPAKRPKCSMLLNTKLKTKLRSWEEALKSYLI